jgi:transposase-like protein
VKSERAGSEAGSGRGLELEAKMTTLDGTVELIEARVREHGDALQKLVARLREGEITYDAASVKELTEELRNTSLALLASMKLPDPHSRN